MEISRFKCKGQIEKQVCETRGDWSDLSLTRYVSASAQAGSRWELRTLVFNLSEGAILVYESDREVRADIKTRIPMTEMILAAASSPGDARRSNEFYIDSTKKTYVFRAATLEQRDAWVKILNTVSPKADVGPNSAGTPSRLAGGSVRPRTSTGSSMVSPRATPRRSMASSGESVS